MVLMYIYAVLYKSRGNTPSKILRDGGCSGLLGLCCLLMFIAKQTGSTFLAYGILALLLNFC